MRKITRLALAAGVALALVAGIASPAAAIGGTIAPPPEPTGLAPVRIAYAGDSTTARTNSWRVQLNPKLAVAVPGYAHSGYTSAQIAKLMPKTSADVLIVKVGINDLKTNTRISTIIANVRTIIAKSGVRRVLVSAICPNDLTSYGTQKIDRRAKGQTLNAALKDFAAANGYEFIDPDHGYRSARGGYTSALYSDDGVHPTTLLFKIEAVAIQKKALAMVGR